MIVFNNGLYIIRQVTEEIYNLYEVIGEAYCILRAGIDFETALEMIA